MATTVPDDLICLGQGAQVHSSAILGYLTGRQIPSLRLEIGAKANIRTGTVIYAGSRIGHGLETGHNVVIREENELGDDVSIWNSSTVDYGCRIGSRVKTHCNVYVAQLTTIEDDAFLAPGVTIANDPHPGCPEFRQCMRGPTIQVGAKIGINTTILPGVTIGAHSLVGAGSVVTRDVAPHTVVYGSPARPLGRIEELACPYGYTQGPYRHLQDRARHVRTSSPDGLRVANASSVEARPHNVGFSDSRR